MDYQNLESNNPYKAIMMMTLVVTLISTFVFAKRIAKCSPQETKNEQNEKQTVMILSGIALLLCIAKTVIWAFPRVRWLQQLSTGVKSLYYLLTLVVVVLNISYISTAKIDTCNGSDTTPSDVLANKNLAIFVLIMSILSLLILFKKGIHIFSQRSGNPLGI